ncbi:uncharacterized protein LOC126056381 [Helicoverpa armigera]|uniref:uncharacterized protein LOC126056381 n=1 Tax=Helicoverpa armigera TaxID=29058 RepID=UPI0030836C85
MSSQKENTRICCLCGSSPSKDPSITLHRFPKPGTKNALRCELWAKYCFPNEAWSSPKFQDASINNIRCYAANISKAHALMRRSCSEQLYLMFNAKRIQQLLMCQINLPYLNLLPVHPE